MNTTLEALGAFFHDHNRFLVLSHVRPDGDAYGSSLGLGMVLQTMGKDVIIANEDGMSERYQFLPGSHLLRRASELKNDPSYKLVAVDTATSDRLGASFVSWGRKPDLNLDHHLSNPAYGVLNWIDSNVPATAQLLFEIISQLSLPCPAEVASNLYVGLMTDTGSFRYRQTTRRTLEIGAALIGAGADPTELAQNCYQTYPLSRILLLREVLQRASFAFDQRVAFFHLTPEMYAISGASKEETEGLLESLQTVGTIEVAFMIEELDPQTQRVSLRSRGTVDVNAIAQKWGGGGHRLAAGIRAKISASNLEAGLLAEIGKQLV